MEDDPNYEKGDAVCFCDPNPPTLSAAKCQKSKITLYYRSQSNPGTETKETASW